MEQQVGSILMQIASEFGLSISILVGMIFYFMKKEKRFEEKDNEINQRLIASFEGLKSVIENTAKATERIEVIADDIKKQINSNITAIEAHNQSLKILSEQLELLKKIDTQAYDFQFKEVNAKLDTINAKLGGKIIAQ